MTNLNLGGVKGYVTGKTNSILNLPPCTVRGNTRKATVREAGGGNRELGGAGMYSVGCLCGAVDCSFPFEDVVI